MPGSADAATLADCSWSAGAVASAAASSEACPTEEAEPLDPRYGITGPISLEEPSDEDRALSEHMMRELDSVFPAETPARMAHRQQVLSELEVVVREWMHEMADEAESAAPSAEDSSLPASPSRRRAARCAFRMVTLGSYRLGVVHPLSDIDALCIGPPCVSREAFVTSFADRLRQLDQVTECVPIPDAYTPIVKVEMRGVKLDLLYARLVKPLEEGEDPEDLLSLDGVLRDIDDKSVRSINGNRNALQILDLVPNRETFRQTLRFVKCWARRRGIYSNMLGFFGGHTWTLLVARVCQLYPNFVPSQLVIRFFRVYRSWPWSTPVMLCKIRHPQTVPGMEGLKVWDPKTNLPDRQHVMPVITPAFPAMNSTHNVTETTKRILLDEIARGYEMVKAIERKRQSWRGLCEPLPYFTRYRYFVWLEILGKTSEAFQKFSGLVESRLRILTKTLETQRGLTVHPNPEQYEIQFGEGDQEWPLGCAMFIAMAFFRDNAHVGMQMDISKACKEFLDVLEKWPEKGRYEGDFLIRLRRVRSEQLPPYALNALPERSVREQLPPPDASQRVQALEWPAAR